MDQDVSNAARAAGCSGYFTWEIAPDHFASLLLTAAKRYARFLKECRLVKSHSEALETIAKAAGFPHWHAFHAVVQGLFDAFNPDVHWPRPEGGREPIKSLIPAFVFMVQASPDCAPTPEEKTGLIKAATQLARACSCQVEQMLDMIGKMNGADTWEKLLHRRPEDAKGPLYGFHVDEEGGGRFMISSACSALIEQQDRLFQGFHSRNESQQKEFEDQLALVLEARPDFLEGLLAKAEVLRYKPMLSREQGKAYNEAINRANELLPAGFKGKISWYDLPNRFYHRLLYGAMVWHAHAGHTAKAVSLARRQLRLNESDNLGVRLWLPVLLVADGQAVAADKASKKMTVEEDYTDAGIELVKAICHFANGRYQQSAEALYMSVFLYPPMRHVVSVDWELLGEAVNDKKSRRTMSPDPDTVVDQYVSATMQLDGLEHAFDRWLGHPEVAAAEAMLAREFQANWRQPNGSLVKWDVEVKAQAALLSKAAAFA
jgi:tetratricopeptide (TPR) repeat protein